MEERRKDSRQELMIVDLEALVPEDHLLRKIEKVMDYLSEVSEFTKPKKVSLSINDLKKNIVQFGEKIIYAMLSDASAPAVKTYRLFAKSGELIDHLLL